MVAIIGLYETLLGGTIAGLPFEIIDTRLEFGRRVQRLLFPGVDQPIYQDFGVLDGPITINGLLIGDDYIQQAQNLRFALRHPGPLTLVHPWYGTLQVVLHGPGAVSISLSQSHLRAARVTMTVLLYLPPAPSLADTLSGLMSQVQATITDAESWIATTLAPALLPLAAFAYAQSWVRSIAAGFASIVNGGPSGAEIGAACAAPLAALTEPATAPTTASAATLAAAIAAVPAAIAGASQPTVPSAVAPGGATMATTAADAADATAMLVQAVPIATAGAVNPSPGPALACALQAIIMANAVAASALIAYDSVQDAEAQAQTLYVELDAAIAAAATQAQMSPQLAAPVWDDLVSLKSALAADLNTVVGRLPAVVTVNTTTAVPAWIVALYVAGDTPGAMYGCYGDIIARNQVANPGVIASGALEILQVVPPATAQAA